MVRKSMGVVLSIILVLTVSVLVHAQAQVPPASSQQPVAAESWAGQLDALTRWVAQQRGDNVCKQRCYALQKLVLRGAVGALLDFELHGTVLAQGPVAVPMFGPPSKVRISDVTQDKAPAAVGFEDNHYYVFTDARRFVIRGKLAFQSDLMLSIPGPLNVFEAELTRGRVLEGSQLAGLVNASVHLDDAVAPRTNEVSTFQLSRAVRVARETHFEYRLVMRSGTDLGVVKLPLRFGENVLDVTGATGWRVDDRELLLPTAGRMATITITGTLPKLGRFEPDERSNYEWWLFESDVEHRVTVAGDARQVDSSESPIARTQPSSKLFLVGRGQQIEASVQALSSVDVLAAIVSRQNRTVVLTRDGNLVSDDQLTYENNGIDYLAYGPPGRPIYLATDGAAERIMRTESKASDVLIPLRKGNHSVRVQSLSQSRLSLWGGKLSIPLVQVPLTVSSAHLTLGFPKGVYPLVVLGGQQQRWLVDWPDAVAVLVGAVAGWLLMRDRKAKALAACVLGGLWFVSPVLFVASLVVGVLALAGWVLTRLVAGKRLAIVLGLLGAVAACALVVGLGAVVLTVSSRADRAEYSVSQAPAAPDVRYGQSKLLKEDDASLVAGGVLQGVTPVPLPMPSYGKSVSVSRELVTRDRPFAVQAYYATSWALLPLAMGWLLALVALVWMHRQLLRSLYERVRDRLARGPSAAAS